MNDIFDWLWKNFEIFEFSKDLIAKSMINTIHAI